VRVPSPWLALGAALLLTACGGTAAPAASVPASAQVKPAAIASAPAKPAASAAASGERLVVSHSQLTSTPNAAAAAAGLFAKHGLNVEVRYIPQGATGQQVLLSGETQFGEFGGAEMVAAAAGGADLLILANLEPVYPFKFMVPKDVQKPADLKGKRIGITTVGSVDDTSIRAALPKFGLDPTKDVTLVPVGPEPARVAALINGQIQGTDATPKAVLDLEQAGMHALFDIAELGLPAATAAIAAQRPWVNGHRDATQRYMDAIVEAIALERKDKAFEQGVMKKVFSIDDQRVLDAVYDYYVLHSMAAVPLPKLEDFKATAEQVAVQNPKVKDLDVPKLLDASFVQSAVDRGLNK